MTDNRTSIYAEKLGAMIRIPTISKNEDEDLSSFYALQKELANLFPLLHTNLEKTELNGTLIFHWKGIDSSQKPILLMGHQDVVPASDNGWIVPAFSGEVVDGALYGRGAIDCKGHLFTILQSIEELLEEGFIPAFDVYIEASINEETRGKGARNAAQYFEQKSIAFSIVIDEGGTILDEPISGMSKPYAVIGVTEKGYMDLKITAKGTGGHSSTPPRKTPAARLFAFAHEIEKKRPFMKCLLPEAQEMFRCMAPAFPFPLRFLLGNTWFFKPLLKLVLPKISPFGEALLATTCCFTMMEGSKAPNVIPKEPYLVANLRTAVHQNCEESLLVIQKYAAKYDLEVEVLQQNDPSSISDIHSSEYAYLTSCIRKKFPDIGIAPYIIMGGTDCRYFQPLTKNAYRFSPLRTTTEQINACHAINENVTVSALTEAVDFFKVFIKEYQL